MPPERRTPTPRQAGADSPADPEKFSGFVLPAKGLQMSMSEMAILQTMRNPRRR